MNPIFSCLAGKKRSSAGDSTIPQGLHRPPSGGRRGSRPERVSGEGSGTQRGRDGAAETALEEAGADVSPGSPQERPGKAQDLRTSHPDDQRSPGPGKRRVTGTHLQGPAGIHPLTRLVVARPRRRPHDKGGGKLDAKERLAGFSWDDLSRSFGVRSHRERATFGLRSWSRTKMSSTRSAAMSDRGIKRCSKKKGGEVAGQA